MRIGTGVCVIAALYFFEKTALIIINSIPDSWWNKIIVYERIPLTNI